MLCPKCNKDMSVKNIDTSNNSTDGKKYDRTLYVCMADDVWVSVEIPQNSVEKKAEDQGKLSK